MPDLTGINPALQVAFIMIFGAVLTKLFDVFTSHKDRGVSRNTRHEDAIALSRTQLLEEEAKFRADVRAEMETMRGEIRVLRAENVQVRQENLAMRVQEANYQREKILTGLNVIQLEAKVTDLTQRLITAGLAAGAAAAMAASTAATAATVAASVKGDADAAAGILPKPQEIESAVVLSSNGDQIRLTPEGSDSPKEYPPTP